MPTPHPRLVFSGGVIAVGSPFGFEPDHVPKGGKTFGLSILEATDEARRLCYNRM
jgi:hypothetical protein